MRKNQMCSAAEFELLFLFKHKSRAALRVDKLIKLMSRYPLWYYKAAVSNVGGPNNENNYVIIQFVKLYFQTIAIIDNNYNIL